MVIRHTAAALTPIMVTAAHDGPVQLLGAVVAAAVIAWPNAAQEVGLYA